jgi:hypothetical protein
MLFESKQDVATFSLSLMGKNWQEYYITEANKYLVTNGILVIAEM